MTTAWSRTTKYIVGVGLVLLGLYVLYLIRTVLPLLVVAALIAVIARPLINWFQHRAHLPRGLAVAVVYIAILIIVPLLMLLAVPAVIDAVQYVIDLDYQTIIFGVRDWFVSWLTSMRDFQMPVASMDSYVDEMINQILTGLQEAPSPSTTTTPPLSSIVQSLGTALTTTFGAAAGLVGAVFSTITLLIFMFLASIYMSLRAHTYKDTFLNLVPVAYQPEIGELMARIGRLWNAFFRGQITLMLMIGVLTWVGLTVLGVPGAIYLGIVAGLLEIVPNLGPVMAAIPAVIVALLQGSSYLPVSNFVFVGIVILFYVLIQQVENTLIVPRVLGDAVELPPLVVMTGVLVGAASAGILGALLATPIIGSAREILFYTYYKLLGEDPFPVKERVEGPRKEMMGTTVEAVRMWVEKVRNDWVNKKGREKENENQGTQIQREPDPEGDQTMIDRR